MTTRKSCVHGSSHMKQNQSSITAHIGDHLYEDPAADGKLLLEKKRASGSFTVTANHSKSQQISKHVLVSVSERVDLELKSFSTKI